MAQNKAQQNAAKQKAALAAEATKSEAKTEVEAQVETQTVAQVAAKAKSVNVGTIGTVEPTTTTAVVEEADKVDVQTTGVVVEDASTESPFQTAIDLAKTTSERDVINLNALIQASDKLLTFKKAGATRETFRECGAKLVSLVRALGAVSDGVFIAAFPVVLDAFEAGSKQEGLLYTDQVAAYKIFANSEDMRALTKGHASFLAALAELAPSATRAKVGKTLDIAVNFAVLPDAKRTRIKDLFR